MTPVTEIFTASRSSENRLIAGVCLAHLMSHYYMMLLAPLFIFIRADFGVSYTELGLALTAFNLVSAVLQTPVGFLVDRVGARSNLAGGLLLGAGAVAVAGLAESYWLFVAMFAVLGLANTVYHPADYALLSERVAPARMTQVFSFHTCSGMIGSAMAPATLLFMQGLVGWRGAFLCAAAIGVVTALIVLLQDHPPRVQHATPTPTPHGDRAASARSDGLGLLLSAPILLNLVFFFVLSMLGSGLNQYLVVGLEALHGTPPALSNAALTGLLAMSAVGVLFGGALAGRTANHNLVTAIGIAVTGGVSLLIAFVDPGAFLLVLVISVSGFASGMAMPSRDMIVRSVTPPGAFGKVFGFVTTGFHIGGVVSPVIFGQFLDHGAPRALFLYIAACAVVAVFTVSLGLSGRRATE